MFHGSKSVNITSIIFFSNPGPCPPFLQAPPHPSITIALLLSSSPKIIISFVKYRLFPSCVINVYLVKSMTLYPAPLSLFPTPKQLLLQLHPPKFPIPNTFPGLIKTKLFSSPLCPPYSKYPCTNGRTLHFTRCMALERMFASQSFAQTIHT